MNKYLLPIVTDCGGSDEGRSKIAAWMCFYPHDVSIPFFPTESMNTLHCGFTAAAHALSTIDHFGPLTGVENIGILANAAPRHGSENGMKLRGDGRQLDGEEIYALLLDNGVWVVGPNAAFNFYFLQTRIAKSFLVTDTSGRKTPFRSMEVMIPALADRLGARKFSHLRFDEKAVPVFEPPRGVFVGDWDDHGNLYLASTEGDEWIPPLGERATFRIGENFARLRHVKELFDGETGEQTLTKGSLKLNGRHVHYIVVVGSSFRSQFPKLRVSDPVVVDRG